MIDKDIILPNGKTIAEAEEASRKKIEGIYLETWRKGHPVPFFDGEGNIYLANPDGSEDEVRLDRPTRTFHVKRRIAAPGKGRMAYLLLNGYEKT